MLEYGYRYRDPEIGVFRSRFTLEDLAGNDRRCAAVVAEALDRYINEQRFSEFQRRYSVPRDAFVHAAGIHLFRRNRYLGVARSEEVRRDIHYNIAVHEDQILTKYFPNSLAGSRHVWTPALRALVRAQAVKGAEYESRVSAGLITRFSERQVLAGFALLIAGLIGIGACLGRVARLSKPSASGSR